MTSTMLETAPRQQTTAETTTPRIDEPTKDLRAQLRAFFNPETEQAEDGADAESVAVERMLQELLDEFDQLTNVAAGRLREKELPDGNLLSEFALRDDSGMYIEDRFEYLRAADGALLRVRVQSTFGNPHEVARLMEVTPQSIGCYRETPDGFWKRVEGAEAASLAIGVLDLCETGERKAYQERDECGNEAADASARMLMSRIAVGQMVQR